MSDFFTLGKVAQILEVPDHRIHYLFRARKIPEVRRVGGRRIFTEQNIRLIAETLGMRDPVPRITRAKKEIKTRQSPRKKRRALTGERGFPTSPHSLTPVKGGENNGS